MERKRLSCPMLHKNPLNHEPAYRNPTHEKVIFPQKPRFTSSLCWNSALSACPTWEAGGPAPKSRRAPQSLHTEEVGRGLGARRVRKCSNAFWFLRVFWLGAFGA